MENQKPSWTSSFGEYARLAGKAWWTMTVCWILGDLVTLALFIWGLWWAPMPTEATPLIWVLFFLVINGLFFAPVISFHAKNLKHHAEIEQLTKQAQGSTASSGQPKTDAQITADARTDAQKTADARVAVLLHVENTIDISMSSSLALIQSALLDSGDAAMANTVAKRELDFKLSALVRSTLKKSEQKIFFLEVETAKTKSPDDWVLLYTVACQCLSGIVTTRRASKLHEFNNDAVRTYEKQTKNLLKMYDNNKLK